MTRFARNNGLTLVFVLLFLGTLVGQWLTGLTVYNEDRLSFGERPVDAVSYMTSGHFIEILAENWESEFLQMLAFVTLTAFLFQRGSPESKEIGKKERVDEDPRFAPVTATTPWPVRRGGLVLALYERSLGGAFLALFLLSFTFHAYGGMRNENEERARSGEPAIGFDAYIVSTRMWFESFQNWQSEFLSVGAMVYLSVYLRQRGSPESKPVATPHGEHG